MTLLVAWNIYSTIKAKDDVKLYKTRLKRESDAFKSQIRKFAAKRLDEMDERLSSFEKCCETRGNEIEAIKAELNNRIKSAEVEVAMANGLLQFTNAEKAKKDFEKRFYEEAYRHFIKALLLYLELNANNGEIRRCADFLSKCLDGLAKADLSFSETVYNDCIKTLDQILTSADFTLSERQRRKIEAIKAQQEDISFTTLYQSIYNFAHSVLKGKGNDNPPAGNNPTGV